MQPGDESYIESFDTESLDTTIVDSDDDGMSDTAIIDIDSNGVPDMIESVHEDGTITTQFDSDGDAVMDIVGEDTNGDGLYETVEFPDNGDAFDLPSYQSTPDTGTNEAAEPHLADNLEPKPEAEPKFGYRFDVPDAQSSSGNPVGSDASGNLFDKETGEPLSKY